MLKVIFLLFDFFPSLLLLLLVQFALFQLHIQLMLKQLLFFLQANLLQLQILLNPGLFLLLLALVFFELASSSSERLILDSLLLAVLLFELLLLDQDLFLLLL